MNNRDKWRPSKFVFLKGKLIGSRDPAELAISSRLMADLVAARYAVLLKQHATGNLLDLGCGKVPLLAVYEPLVQSVTCVDWANTLHPNEFIDMQCDLTQPLPFPNDRFDTIILSDVLEHVPTPNALWQEVARVLAVGGKVLLNVPFFYWIHEAPHDYYRYTEFALRRFADETGLTVLSLEAIGGIPEVLCDLSAKTIERIPFIGPSFATFIQWSGRLFLKTSIGCRMSQNTRAAFPFGYFMVVEKHLQ